MQTNDRNHPSIPPMTPSTAQVPLPNAVSPALTDSSSVSEEELIIPLLEERLNVIRRRQKIGEIVIRREVETRIVEVPIRREKLIVEQVSPVFRQIALVDLGDQEEISLSKTAPEQGIDQTLNATYTSVHDASRALETIANTLTTYCHAVQINLFIQRGGSVEQAAHRFETLATAVQMLDAIAFPFANQCHQVDLKVVANAEVLQRADQYWLEQNARGNPSVLIGAVNFSIS